MEQYQQPSYPSYSDQYRQDQRGHTFPPPSHFAEYAVRGEHKQDMDQVRQFGQQEFDNYYGKQLGANHVSVILSHRRDSITSL